MPPKGNDEFRYGAGGGIVYLDSDGSSEDNWQDSN
jgi:hypothetical protein